LEDAPEYDSKVVLNADLIKQYLAGRSRSLLKAGAASLLGRPLEAVQANQILSVQVQEHSMARDAIVPEEFAQKFATEKDTPYARWVRSEGLDIIGAHYVRTCAPLR